MSLKPNFLVLDEPTNHLDITTREAVEEALDSFEGTILVVSHDRYFLDKVVNRVVEVKDRGLVSYSGNFSEFWYARQRSEPVAKGSSQGPRRRKPVKTNGAKSEVPDYAALEALERRIQDAEARKLDLERRITDAFIRRDHREGRRAQRQLERARAQIEHLYNRWLTQSS